MNFGRFEDLLGKLLDGELTLGEGDELAAILRGDPDRMREVRHHLVLWELWVQQQAPERSAEAFVAACRTRVRAEGESGSFVARLGERMARAATGRGEVRPRWATFVRGWRTLCRPPGLAWAAAACAVVAVFGWFALPHTVLATTTTIHGDAVCTACFLHETHDHAPAIRVHEGGTTRIYYVQSDRRAIVRLGDYCAAPVPLVATGRTEMKDGRRLFNARAVAAEIPPAVPAPKESERILFPF